jgi:cysteine desulfurase/selenocysteine lyase
MTVLTPPAKDLQAVKAPFDVAAIRADFPILSREVNGKKLVYLDNGASALRNRY